MACTQRNGDLMQKSAPVERNYVENAAGVGDLLISKVRYSGGGMKLSTVYYDRRPYRSVLPLCLPMHATYPKFISSLIMYTEIIHGGEKLSLGLSQQILNTSVKEFTFTFTPSISRNKREKFNVCSV